MTRRLDYPKPAKMFEVITIYGQNIIAAEFDEWKRHRRIAGPSFSDKNNKLVHEETTQLTTELLDRWSTDGGEVVNIEHAVTFTSKLTVMITTIAGEFCARL
jgi:cytochrome P450